MTPAHLALLRAEAHLVERLEQLGPKLITGEPNVWIEYAQTAAALAAIAPVTAPGANGELLTTAQMAARLAVAPKTLLRRAKRGEITPVRSGQRGRAALRWAAR